MIPICEAERPLIAADESFVASEVAKAIAGSSCLVLMLFTSPRTTHDVLLFVSRRTIIR